MNVGDKLIEVFEEVNILFNEVFWVREVVLDVYFFVLVLDLGKEKVK